jgi:hypothetical protein
MLYYPFVQPPQAALHQALLYWDGIASFVPNGREAYEDALSGSDLQELKDRNLYQPLALDARYQEFLLQRMEDFPALTDALIRSAPRRGGLAHRDWVWSYNGKVDSQVEDALSYLNLTHRVNSPSPLKSVAIPRKVLTLLAGTIAQEVARSTTTHAYTPYTDEQSIDDVSLNSDPGQGVAAWRVQLGQLLPAPSPAVTTQQILDFRDKYEDERERLISATQEMIAGLCRNWEHPADIIRRMQLELENARQDYMGAAKGARIAWTERSLSVTAAVAATAVGALVLPDLAWISGILGSIGFNIATREIRPLRAGQKGHPFSYLQHVENHLSGRAGSRAIRRR